MTPTCQFLQVINATASDLKSTVLAGGSWMWKQWFERVKRWGFTPPDVGLKSSAEFEALTQLKVLKTANFSFYYWNQLEVSDWMRPIRQDAAGVKESNTTLAANRLNCWFISNQVKFQSSQRIAWCWRDLSVAFDCKTFPEGARGLWTLQRHFFFLTWSNFKCCDILGNCVELKTRLQRGASDLYSSGLD